VCVCVCVCVLVWPAFTFECSGHAMVTADDQIYVIGGCNDRLVLCEVESRREELNEWQQQPDMVSPRY
jgi:hypothetical protein